MKNKRITAVILAVVTITSCLFTQGVSAAKTSKTDITVFSGNTKQILTAVESNSKIYFSAEDYSKITRYKYTENDTAVIYTLGEKSVSVNKSNKALTVGVPIQKTFEYSGAVTDGGTTYLPASEILPWLNVECYADGNTFVVKPDDITLWEVTEKIKNTRAEFNIITEMGGDLKTMAAITALTALDGMLSLNPTRLMPCNDEGDTLYTIEAYRDTITDLAADDYFKSDEALKAVKKVSNVNKVYKTIGELFPALNENTISDFLTSNYADNDTMMTFYNISDSLTTASALAEAAGATTDILKMWKLFEVAGQTQPDFLESVKLLYKNSQQSSAIKLGAKKALSALTSNKEVAETISKDNKIPISSAMALNVFDWGISYLMDKSQKKGLSVMLGGYGTALKGINALLTLVYPKGRKAISEVANLTIYDGIQRCAADYAKGLISATPDSQAVHEARIMLMLSLKASKKSYSAMAQLLSAIGGEGLKDREVANIDELLTELAYCESSELNDAVEDKTAKADEIAKLLSQINGEPHTAAETTGCTDTPSAQTTETVSKQDVDLTSGTWFLALGPSMGGQYHVRFFPDGWFLALCTGSREFTYGKYKQENSILKLRMQHLEWNSFNYIDGRYQSVEKHRMQDLYDDYYVMSHSEDDTYFNNEFASYFGGTMGISYDNKYLSPYKNLLYDLVEEYGICLSSDASTTDLFEKITYAKVLDFEKDGIPELMVHKGLEVRIYRYNNGNAELVYSHNNGGRTTQSDSSYVMYVKDAADYSYKYILLNDSYDDYSGWISLSLQDGKAVEKSYKIEYEVPFWDCIDRNLKFDVYEGNAYYINGKPAEKDDVLSIVKDGYTEEIWFPGCNVETVMTLMVAGSKM